MSIVYSLIIFASLGHSTTSVTVGDYPTAQACEAVKLEYKEQTKHQAGAYTAVCLPVPFNVQFD